MQPYFSIVIPTKNRPECISIILSSIERQSFDDFEVIVSDNGFLKTCVDVVNSMDDDRIKYFSTTHPLGMCDSFEDAIGHANGRWIMLLGDKNILYPKSLEKLYSVTKQYNPEIVNYSQERLKPINIERDLICGKLQRRKKGGGVHWINPKRALGDHLKCIQLFDMTDNLWNIGCVYGGGIYSENFVRNIRLSHDSGRVFDGIVPDRYGAVDALCIAEKVLWLDDEICIYDNCGRHDWASTQKKGIEEINAFVMKSRADLDYTEKLLIPGVTASMNNILASDYVNAVRSSVPSDCFASLKNKIDMSHLLVNIENDLLNGSDLSDSVRGKQKILFDAYVKQMNKSEREDYYSAKKANEERKALNKAKSLFGLKSLIDKCIGEGVFSNSKALSLICIELENFLSKGIVIVRDLWDIE